MTLIEDCGVISAHCTVLVSGEEYDRCNTAFAACGAGIVVWQRDSFILGSILPSIYYVIQVVDGNGNKLATWDQFVLYQQNEVTDENPNRNTFASLKKGSSKGSNGSNAGFCQCAYTGSRPYGLDSLAPWEGLNDVIAKGTKRRLRDTSTPKRRKIKGPNKVGRKRERKAQDEICLDIKKRHRSLNSVYVE
jgi:hypothetical protein